ncbi:exosome complex exonuclease RRP40 [Pseudovirgaria hyperparasitica]|uniref:Exosome complex exonuclease RRP40 n=1 Tax=Pseudovirgaria hyperparasitica TaxID=470096 RepID=A0A6A6W7M1_9PEZI|nr:exosome complex exonuclease RRP40 [Pseudovirgaria hyperparasitica]KAF2757577.1 exosome complex exonuclease RRP40 [Pseudovirgaria hyperparasitica]
MSLTGLVVLPGDPILPSHLPSSSKNPGKALTIGPGLRHIPPTTVTPTTGGALIADDRKPAVWVENNSGRYIPAVGDLVICTVQRGSAEWYYCSITPHTPLATLGNLEFEGANRKNRPNMLPGALVYARIVSAHPNPPHQEPTLTCISPTTQKADGMGPLKGGMVFRVSLGLARRLLMGSKGKLDVLERLAQKGVRFEIAVGRNGVVWVEGQGGDVKTTLAVGRLLQEVDEKVATLEEQGKMVEKVARTLK